MACCELGTTLRPYQLLCVVCALGEERVTAIDPATAELLARLRARPDAPVTLRCNAGDLFGYQDPGTADDTPGGADFNRLRDLEILHKLDLFPGCTLPARNLWHRVLALIEKTDGLCGADAAWPGCPKAGSGCYERGRDKGLDALFLPRPLEEMQREKQASLAAMQGAEAIRVRPHILLCGVCQYGQGIRPPYPEDNLPELFQLFLQEPDRRITLAPGADWMMCAPCPYRTDEGNCVIHQGICGLANQLRDLRTLRKLGLSFGDTLPARDLFRLIFERIPGTLAICKLDHRAPSVWGDPCGKETQDVEAYEQGKQQLKAALGLQ
ncbi:MAG: hypothetical protein ACYDCO_19185 [Armatimonadota bacterium]